MIKDKNYAMLEELLSDVIIELQSYDNQIIFEEDKVVCESAIN